MILKSRQCRGMATEAKPILALTATGIQRVAGTGKARSQLAEATPTVISHYRREFPSFAYVISRECLYYCRTVKLSAAHDNGQSA